MSSNYFLTFWFFSINKVKKKTIKEKRLKIEVLQRHNFYFLHCLHDKLSKMTEKTSNKCNLITIILILDVKFKCVTGLKQSILIFFKIERTKISECTSKVQTWNNLMSQMNESTTWSDEQVCLLDVYRGNVIYYRIGNKTLSAMRSCLVTFVNFSLKIISWFQSRCH